MNERFLPIWCRPEDSYDIEPIKAAKTALDLDFKVYPCPVTETTTGRCLAIGTHPPYFIDHFLVAPTASHEELVRAIRWVLSDDDDWEATLVIDQMQAIMSAEARELLPEELEGEKRMSDYLNGRV